MPRQPGDVRVPSVVVAQCQEEIHQIMQALRELADATGMETWAFQIKHNYRMALDDLAVLEAYLELVKAAPEVEREDGGTRRDPLNWSRNMGRM